LISELRAETAISTPPPPSPETLTFRSEMGRISRQSGVVFAGTIFTGIFGYVFKVYLARVLGAEALGIYALGMTIVGFLGLLNALGLPQSAVRFVALYTASGRFAELASLLWKGSGILCLANLVFAGVVMGVGPWVANHIYHAPTMVRYLPLFAVIMVLGALNSFFGKVLAGYKQVGLRTIVTNFVSSPVTMAVTVVLVALGAGLGGYLVAQIVSAVVVLVLVISLVWRFTPAAARFVYVKNLHLDREIWSFSAATFGLGLMEFLMVQADRITLGVYRTAHVVGIYATAAALVAYEPIILQSVNQIFSPVIADLHTRAERAVLGRLFQTITKWVLGLTFPLAAVMMIFSRPIMRIFGHEFEIGWPILAIGTLGQLVNCGVGSVGFLLLMSGNERRLVRVQTTMAVAMVVLCLVLVPRWGIWGAAVAAALTNIVGNIWNLREVRSALGLSPYNRSYLKLLPALVASLLITLLASWVCPPSWRYWVVILLALFSSYIVFAALMFAAGLNADDRLVVDAVWTRVRGNSRRIAPGVAL
jgi:O-antigen/teichoic acid export membrane protein